MSLHTTKKNFLKISIFLFVSSTLCIKANISDQAIISTYQGTQGPWKYLEYLFIIKPQQERTQITDKAFTALGVIGAGIFAKEYYTKKETTTNSTKATPTLNPIKYIPLALSGLAIGKTIYNFFNDQAKSMVQKKTLSQILQNWQTHRAHIPTTLVEYFDELAAQYQSKGQKIITATLVSNVFGVIEHHVEHHFENRYKKAEMKSADPIETFKNCTDIWTSFK